MKNFWKWVTALASIGAVAGLIFVLVHKKFKKCTGKTNNFTQDTPDDEDFDLDADLAPAEEQREYVPLNKTTQSKSETIKQTDDSKESKGTKEAADKDAE